jgi:iron(III) transport system substrate-binding protein
VGAGGSTAALTRFQVEKLGPSWLTDYAANKPRIFDSSANLTDSLARGEIDAGAIPVATAYGAIQEGAPITIVAPKEGAAGYPFYVGEASTAKHPAAAQVFINWIMSKAGQKLAASQGDFPVRSDVGSPTAGDLKLPSVDSGWLAIPSMDDTLANLKADADLWTQTFGYTG